MVQNFINVKSFGDKPLVEIMRENPDAIIFGSDDRDMDNYDPNNPYKGLSSEELEKVKAIEVKLDEKLYSKQ